MSLLSAAGLVAQEHLHQLARRARAYDKPIAGYIPRTDLAAVGVALYSIVAILLWTHWYRQGKHRWMLSLTIGTLCMTIGFFTRIGCHYKAYDLGIYVVSTLFILLSPCAFLASNYIALSHIARYLGDDVTKHCLAVPATIIVKFFVVSDVSTFLIQAAGGAMTASGQNNPKMGDIGRKVSMAGLSLQGASFASYTVILLYFGIQVRKKYPYKWNRATSVTNKHQFNFWKILDRTPVVEWRILYYTVCVTCIGFLVRSGFRIAEFKDGYSGYLYTHEGYFWALDALPILLAISAFVFVWPPRFLKHPELFRDEEPFGSTEMSKTSATELPSAAV